MRLGPWAAKAGLGIPLQSSHGKKHGNNDSREFDDHRFWSDVARLMIVLAFFRFLGGSQVPSSESGDLSFPLALDLLLALAFAFAFAPGFLLPCPGSGFSVRAVRRMVLGHWGKCKLPNPTIGCRKSKQHNIKGSSLILTYCKRIYFYWIDKTFVKVIFYNMYIVSCIHRPGGPTSSVWLLPWGPAKTLYKHDWWGRGANDVVECWGSYSLSTFWTNSFHAAIFLDGTKG